MGMLPSSPRHRISITPNPTSLATTSPARPTSHDLLQLMLPGITTMTAIMAIFALPAPSTVVMSYWLAVNQYITNGPAPFTEPAKSPDKGQVVTQHTTYWDNGYNRGYLMYLAEQVLVPGWTIPGEVTFDDYPSAYTHTGDIVNVLN